MRRERDIGVIQDKYEDPEAFEDPKAWYNK